MYIHLFIYRYISRLYLYMYICIHIYICNFYLQLLNYRLLLKFVYTHSVRGLYANQTVGFTNEKAIFGLRDPASVPEQWWSGWIISRTQAVGDTWLLRYVHGSGVYCAESGLKPWNLPKVPQTACHTYIPERYSYQKMSPMSTRVLQPASWGPVAILCSMARRGTWSTKTSPSWRPT